MWPRLWITTSDAGPESKCFRLVGQVTQSGIITSPSSWHKQSQTIQKRTYLACAPTKQQAKLESWAVVCPKPALHGGHTYSDSWRGVPLIVNTGILDYRLHKTCQYKTLGTVPGWVGAWKIGLICLAWDSPLNQVNSGCTDGIHFWIYVASDHSLGMAFLGICS